MFTPMGGNFTYLVRCELSYFGSAIGTNGAGSFSTFESCLFNSSNIPKHLKLTSIIFASRKHIIAYKRSGNFNVSFFNFFSFVISFAVHHCMRQRQCRIQHDLQRTGSHLERQASLSGVVLIVFIISVVLVVFISVAFVSDAHIYLSNFFDVFGRFSTGSGYSVPIAIPRTIVDFFFLAELNPVFHTRFDFNFTTKFGFISDTVVDVDTRVDVNFIFNQDVDFVFDTDVDSIFPVRYYCFTDRTTKLSEKPKTRPYCANISWYYNYGHMPSTPFASDSGTLRKRQSATSSPILYIPMLWGDFPGTFLSDTIARIQAGERVPYVLGFNEPDLGFDVGGSSITPARAAEVWVQQLEPLRAYGVSLGAPAVSGSPDGFTWLRNWFLACAGRCNPEFLPAHYYGDFSGLAGHLGQIKGTYPNLTIWVTEFAYAHSSARNSEIFLNQTLNYFDVTLPPEYGLTHYSYFGGFRSDVSNVGAGATMLDANGKLTNIGRIYLGQFAEDTFEIQSATTATPTTGTSSLALATSSSRSSSSLAMPSPSLVCPQSNGTSYRVNVIDFTIQCYVDHYGGNYSGSPVDVDSFEECIALCGNLPNCVDVSYDPNGPCWPKMELLYASCGHAAAQHFFPVLGDDTDDVSDIFINIIRNAFNGPLMSIECWFGT
ncbi:hypothetical protein H2199_001259 [Coniosporium tulheliwenetii]|uniref:Uncharacterized protein n=1 Tax=Coniosporium tulheliwenetii TaxID=3383036 RepID=A0ACC2ZLI1_9PEZI|nr:hypothetical protein H2199_001259 [Cladosporium sp. JES 115]